MKDGKGNYRVAKAGDEGATSTIAVKGGKVNIYGLAGKEYTLTETKAPDGYNKLEESVTVDLTSGSLIKANITEAGVYENGGKAIANHAGTVLPSTGGMGTTLFYVIGGGLMVAAVVLLVTKKRMGNK